uniref:(northern house mosquito) hypothetical protein n=1 Tax=Culex pipiens TaxID=7175 RepID=A0A8D8BAR2_CULPI
MSARGRLLHRNHSGRERDHEAATGRRKRHLWQRCVQDHVSLRHRATAALRCQVQLPAGRRRRLPGIPSSLSNPNQTGTQIRSASGGETAIRRVLLGIGPIGPRPHRKDAST